MNRYALALAAAVAGILLGVGGLSCGPSNCPNQCAGVCTDVQRDPVNCGTCGARCATGICHQGGCVDMCPAGSTQCGGTCADLQVDAFHCGACGNKCNGGSCNAGVCQC